MDPKDPSNVGGMQAKGKGPAKKGGNAPGKVANTDHYGHGGTEGRTAPGKRSGTEHLPDGPNGEGEGKAHLNEGKFGGGPGKQGLLEPPKAKDVVLPAKGAKKAGAAAPKLDGAKVPAKGKGAGEPKHDAQPAAQINHVAPAAFEPRAAEPAKLTDVPDVAPPAAVVIAPPAKGKTDPTFETLRSEISTLSGLIKSSHDEILAASKQLQQTVANQLTEYAASIDQKVEAGTKRVGTAYDTVSKAITDAGMHANEEITKREQTIPATIKAARDKKAGEIKNLVNQTKLDAHAKVTQGPQAAAAKQTAIAFADSIKAKHAELKNRIKTDTSPGGAVAGKLNPKQYSAQVQVGGQAARDVGLQALAEDKRLALITKAADQALKFIDSVLKPKEESYRKTSGIVIDESLGVADKDLDKAVAQHEPEQQKNLDDAANLATKSLQKQVATQRAGITSTQKTATTRLAKDRKAAEEGAHKAGKQLSEDIKHGSKEIQNKLAKKAAQDAASYSKLTQILHQIGASKKLDAPTRTKLDNLKAQLDTARAENKKTLEELATSAVAQLKSGKEQQYEQAIQTHENNATRTKAELVGAMTTATSSLGQSFDTIGTSFDATVASATKKLDVDLKFYTNEAPKVPEAYGATLDKQLTAVIKGLGAGADQMLEPLKMQEKLDKDSEPAIKAAMKTGPEDAHGLWDAMDGVGTDENKIFGILRKATPGEIVFIEGCYNDAYSKRGTSKYPSPLRADLDDELSGSEWDIAFAYLRHEREKALKLELDNSTHWYNDEEDRIEEVLRAASDEEMQNIMASTDGKAAVEGVKKHLSSCDLDVVNALTNTDIPIAERKVQADAIRVYDAMYGGLTGAGTDEAKIKEKLAACKTKEERQALHDAYNAYIRQKDPLQVAELERQAGKGADLMDASFDDEMSGGEWTTVRTMSETKLSDEEHDATLKMAKLVEGAQGGGTDEDMMVEALEDEKYAEEYAKEKDPVARAALAKKHEEDLDKRLQYITDNGMMTKSFKKDGEKNGVADIIKGEMGSSSITFEELLERRWSIDKTKRGDKAGLPIENIAGYQAGARAEILNLEQMVAQRTLQAGKAEPELLIAYACWGVSGTDETTLKKALKKNGELRTKNEVFKLREAFFKAWGVDMMEGSNELDRKDFKAPGGVVPSEVDGKDGLEVRVALMGKPENPAEIAYVDNVRYRFVTTGTGQPSPWSHAREDMEVNHKNLQAKAAEHIDDKDLKAFDAQKPPELTDEQKQANARKTTADPINTAAYLEDNRLETLAGYAEKSEMAFLEAKEAMANAVITVIELIGAALITAASMGASSPMLVMFIGNLILSGMTIMMRKDMVGDAYGAEDIGIDVIKGIVMAAIQAGGEAKFISDFAGKAGKMAGKAWEIFAGGAEKGGMRIVEGQALALGEKAALTLEKQAVKAAESTAVKTATKEGEKVAVSAAEKEVESVAAKEALTTAEKVGTKEAAEIGAKEAATTAEKAGAKEAAEVTTATAVAKKTAKEKVEALTTAGMKNATTTALSETAQFVMDEKTYEMKFWDALFDNPNSLGRRLLNSVPSAFAQGAVQDYISNIANASSPKAVGKIRSGSEAMFRQILAEFGGNAAGFLTHLDNYQDAGTFWIEFLKSSARSVASGGFNGIFGHAMRAKALARELVNAHKEGGDLHEILAKIHEAAGYMQADEASNLANHVASMDPKSVDLLPEAFKKYVNKQTTAGANVTQPGGDTTPNTQKSPADEKQAAAKKTEEKQAAKEEAKPVVDEKKTPAIEPTEEEKKAAKPVTTADEDKKVTGGAHDEKKAAVVDEQTPKTEEKSASDKDAPKKESTVSTGSTLEHGADSRSTTKNLEHETTNNVETTARAKAALETLKPTEQHEVRKTLAAAENEGQKVMLERSLAAGRKPHELEALRGAMKGMSADEVAAKFTGAGVVQFYQQSCLPTAYQIAIADVDPYYAFDLRNHPEKVMDEQRKVLQDAGSAQTKRKDVEEGSPRSKNVDDHVEEKDGMGKKLNDPKSYSEKGEKDGMPATAMEGKDLHKQLEQATGHSYEILVNQKWSDGYTGPDSYQDGSTPHERIMAALDKKLPVIVSKVTADGTGHAITLIGYEKGPDGHIRYVARDPATGRIDTKTPSQFEGFGGFAAVTIPAGVGTEKVEPHPGKTSPKTGAEDVAQKTPAPQTEEKPSAKTRDDHERQTEKPDAETDDSARERRSQGVKPRSKDAKVEDWAHPSARKDIPETVPLSRQELRDLVTEKYHETLEKFLTKEKTGLDPNEASPYDKIITDLKKEKPGTIDKAKADEYLARWGAAAKEMAEKTGHNEAELRVIYNVVEQDDFKVWFKATEKLPKEQQAMLAHMWREELKLYVRDMMSDEKSKEVLYLRDLAMSGDRRGPKFDKLFEGKLKKTEGDADAAYDGIMGSSKESNKNVNKTITNSADGLDEEMAKKIRGEAGTFTGEKKFDSKGRELVPDAEGKLVPKPEQVEEKSTSKTKATEDEQGEVEGQEEKSKETAAKDDESKKTSTLKSGGAGDKHDATQEQKDKGHAGVEVHSHFIGNVPDQLIKAQIGKSVGEVPNQVSEWEPLLREITKLKTNDEVAHKRGDDGKIKTRGTGGDAVEQAQQAVKEIAELKRDIKRAEEGKGKYKGMEAEERKAKILGLKEQIDTKARETVQAALKATEETDFNSSYAVRDELIKKHYGGEARDAVLGTLSGKLTGEALGDAATLARLREHFEGRETVLDRIKQAEEIQSRAKKGLSDKDKTDLAKLKQSIEDQFAYDQYSKETISRLAEDNIKYTEQSNSGKKLDERFDKDQLTVLKKQLIDEQRKIIETSPDPVAREAAQKKMKQLEDLQIAHLAMVNTSFFGQRDKLGNEGEFANFDRESEDGKKAWNKELDRVVKQAGDRNDTAGVDIAGMEHFRFDQIGKDRMIELAMRLAAVATPEHPIVLRPHVGEGAVDTVAGESANINHDRYKAQSGKELSHYDRGRSNVDRMLEVFQAIADKNGGRLPPNLIVRFGHVTHASPDAIVKMAKLGIIAEVNLTSNIKTGSVNQNPEDLPKPQKGEAKPNLPERLEDHSLPSMIFAGAPVILSTDSHEVMGTDLPSEYQRAKDQIEKVRNNEQAIRVTVEQAQARGWDVQEGPPPHGTVFYYQLDGDEKKRFDGAYDKLYNDANKYYANRPNQDGGRKLDPGDDGSQTPKVPPPGTIVGPAVPPDTAKAVKQNSKVEEQNEHLKRLQKDLRSTDDAVKAKAREELDRLHADPDWHDALKLNQLFDIGVKHKENKGTEDERKADSEALSKNIPALMAEIEKKKVGADPVLQGKRDHFERAVAMEILNNGKVRAQIDNELKRLCDIAYDYITKTRTTEAEQAKALSDMHTDASKGYGGGLRTKEMQEQVARGDYTASTAKMMEVLKEGNIRERMLALQEFANILGKDALSADGRAKILAAGDTTGNTRKYSAEDAKKLVERAIKFQDVTEVKDQKPANLFKPTMEEAADPLKHKEYAAAKASRDESGHELDTKLLPLLQDKINEYLGKSLAANPGQLSGAGENNPLARTTITVREAMQQGLRLSQREIDAIPGGLDGQLNWVVGSKANIVNENLPFIQNAKQDSMPLKAGISGTTYRFMQIVDMLGGDPKLGRLAAIASLQAADAHSFHEIAVAAKGFGVDYNSSQPYSHMADIPGLEQADLERIAKSVGTSMEELNGATPGAKSSP